MKKKQQKCSANKIMDFFCLYFIVELHPTQTEKAKEIGMRSM